MKKSPHHLTDTCMSKKGISWRKRLVFAFILVLLTALAGEFFLRVAFSTPWVLSRIVARDSASCRLKWVQRRMTHGNTYDALDQYDPTKGWRTQSNLRDLVVFENCRLNTNSRGFRGTREYSEGRLVDRPRIMVIGDSFTFGDEINDHETYSHCLQASMPWTEILNCGVHGYGHDQMLLLLREELPRYRPEIVILGFVYLDMYRNLLHFRDYAKPRFLLKDDQLLLTHSPVPDPETVLQDEWRRVKLIDLWAMVRFRIERVSGAHQYQTETLCQRLLHAIADEIINTGATPVFVFLPIGEDLKVPATMEDREAFLLDFGAKRPDVRIATLRPLFEERMAEGHTFRLEGHWAPPTHQIVAEYLERFLIDTVLPPPPKDNG